MRFVLRTFSHVTRCTSYRSAFEHPDGTRESRKLTSSRVTSTPVTRILAVGTKAQPVKEALAEAQAAAQGELERVLAG